MSARGRRDREAPRAVGVDTGGTFTDFVARVGGRLTAFKRPSTPTAPERAVLDGLAALGVAPTTRVRHGSTVATNALIERRGARTVFVTTRGFEDVLEIGRQDRPALYALAPRRPEPLVPAARRLGVRERRGPGGEVVVPLTAAEIARVVRAVRAARPEAIAIGLLHAYASPAHERRLARALARLGVPVTASSALCPEFREYERFATTAANAFLAPRVARYLGALARGTRGRLEIVLSHGGHAPPRQAAREPVRQLLSGPAAGVAAAHAVARACGFARALTLDVGGTSTDVAHVAGDLPRRRARELAGVPIQLPMLDVETVGAGGGSIVRVDAGGLLRVGPDSAGADPGPACYGQGGPATVTDALAVLGRLPATLGGSVTLDLAAARAALAPLARALGARSLERAAAGVVVVADALMEAALRRVSVERGHDPRGAALIAFGGAGGLHAAALGAALGCDAVVFPAWAGVLSALGALAAGARREKSRSVLLDAGDAPALERAWAALERETLAAFDPAERPRVRVERWAEVRYCGQSHELSLAGGAGLARRFHAEHARRFGFATPERAVEVVTVEVRAEGPASWTEVLPRGRTPRATRRAAPVRRTRAWDGAWREVPVHACQGLVAGDTIDGPALVEADGATLWLPRGRRGTWHAAGALIVRERSR